MIVFMDNPAFGQAIAYNTKTELVYFNLSSLYSGYESITNLLINIAPPTQVNMVEYINSVSFDMQYAECIMNSQNMFISLMKIMMNEAEGRTVAILVQRDPYRDSIMESLIKFIQQRYGINSWIIEDESDIECIHQTYFTPGGLMTYDADKNRCNQMYMSGSRSILNNINVE